MCFAVITAYRLAEEKLQTIVAQLPSSFVLGGARRRNLKEVFGLFKQSCSLGRVPLLHYV